MNYLQARIRETQPGIQSICVEFVDRIPADFPLGRLAVVLLRPDQSSSRVAFSWQAPRSGERPGPAPENQNLADGKAPTTDATMNIPLRNSTGVLGAVLFHSGASPVYTPQHQHQAQGMVDLLAARLDDVGLCPATSQPSPRVAANPKMATRTPQPLEDIVHPLRTTLTSIKAYVSSLLQPDISWSDELRDEFLRTVEQEADRLNQLVNDLLARTKLDPR